MNNLTIFNTDAFALNPDADIEIIKTETTTIAVVDDFYKDFDAVEFEVNKLPAAITGCDIPGEMFDARKSYMGNMKGTVMPFTHELSDLVCKVIGYDGEAETSRELLVNCNKLLCDKNTTHQYNIHRDNEVHEMPQQIATVVMLNCFYDEGEGFNIYKHKLVIGEDMEHYVMWTDRSVAEVDYFVQGKRNRAILFSTAALHGAALGGSQFKNEMRMTQVAFTKLL